jgi:hypothetical protein
MPTRGVPVALSWVIAILLWFAAATKLLEVLQNRIDIKAIFALAIILLEVVLAAWLASGIRANAARVAAILAFVGFCAVSGFKALAGESSCGCFGSLRVPPAAMLGIDLLALGALVVLPTHAPPNSQHSPTVRSSIFRVAATLLLGIGISQGTLASVRQWPTLANVKATETRVGDRLPFETSIDIREEISSGRWIVV